MKRIISIQSQVAYGHVGNSAAVFPMQAKGIEVIAVPTALLSNHPRYPSLRGQMLAAPLVADLLLGIEERGLVDENAILLTGYLGTPETARVVADFVRRHPGITAIVDPVMGDDDLGTFVKPELVEVFREALVPLASLITPNQYELELLTGLKARDLAGVGAALAALGKQAAVVTGCVLEDTAPGFLETVVLSNGALSRSAVAKLPIRPCGTGDLLTGLISARLAAGVPLPRAAAAATAEIHAVLRRTEAAGTGEMRLAGFPFSPADQEAQE